MITLPSLILYLINRDDPEYFQLPRWRRWFFWHLRNPFWTEKSSAMMPKWFMFPKPWELGFVYGSLPESIAEYYDRKNPAAFDGMSDALLQILPDPRPTALQALWHQLENRDAFGRSIVTLGQEGLRPEYQAKPYTPSVWKGIGAVVHESPARMHQAWRDTTGTIGSYLDSLASLLIDTHNPRTAPPESVPADIPFVRAFTARRPGFQSSSVEALYKRLDELERNYKTARLPLRGKDVPSSLVDQAEREYQELLDLRDAARTIGEGSGVYDAVRESPRLSASEKREYMEQIESTVVQIAKDALAK